MKASAHPNVSACEPPRTWRTYLRRLLFPIRHCPAPIISISHRDYIVIHTICKLTFTERILLLCSGRFEVTTRTYTEFEIGSNSTASTHHVLPPKILDESGSRHQHTG